MARYGTRKGQPRTYGEYALDVQCTWRITGAQGIVATDDTWDGRMLPWLDRGPYAVESIASDDLGGLRIGLAGGYVVDVFPDSADDVEHWRFFRTDDPKAHFVVETGGNDATA